MIDQGAFKISWSLRSKFARKIPGIFWISVKQVSILFILIALFTKTKFLGYKMHSAPMADCWYTRWNKMGGCFFMNIIWSFYSHSLSQINLQLYICHFHIQNLLKSLKSVFYRSFYSFLQKSFFFKFLYSSKICIFIVAIFIFRIFQNL